MVVCSAALLEEGSIAALLEEGEDRGCRRWGWEDTGCRGETHLYMMDTKICVGTFTSRWVAVRVRRRLRSSASGPLGHPVSCPGRTVYKGFAGAAFRGAVACMSVVHFRFSVPQAHKHRRLKNIASVLQLSYVSRVKVCVVDMEDVEWT